MNDQQLEDLKQFIDSKILQTESNLGSKIEKLRLEMNDGFAGVGEAVEQINQIIDDEKVKEVDRRLTKLEQRAA